MMASEDIHNMMFLIADRFGWSLVAIESMPIRKLILWYETIIKMIDMEQGNGKK